jgi:hypothetical protein
MPKPSKTATATATHNNNPRKIRLESLRANLPPTLRRDPLGVSIWQEIETLSEGEALELPGRGRDARRIGRAVAKWARERGWAMRVFSVGENAYIARL